MSSCRRLSHWNNATKVPNGDLNFIMLETFSWNNNNQKQLPIKNVVLKLSEKFVQCVIVKLDNNFAGIYYINLVKDHTKNDQVDAYFFTDPKATLDVTDKLAAGKVK